MSKSKIRKKVADKRRERRRYKAEQDRAAKEAIRKLMRKGE